MASKRQNIFDLAGAAAFLNFPPGAFAAFVRAGNDLPEHTDGHDLCEIRFTLDALARWRLEHSFGRARA